MTTTYNAPWTGASTVLTSYTPVVGSSPLQPGGYGNTLETDGSAKVRAQGGGFGRVDIPITPCSVLSITVPMRMPTLGETYLFFRLDTGASTSYSVVLANSGTPTLQIVRNGTVVASVTGYTGGQTYAVLVTCSATHVINVYVDGAVDVALTYTDGSGIAAGIAGFAMNSDTNSHIGPLVITDTVDTPTPPTDYPEPYTRAHLRSRYANKPPMTRWFGSMTPSAKIISQEFFNDSVYIGAAGERPLRLSAKEAYTLYIGNRTLF